MSRLQTALRAYPPGTVVTRAMFEDQKVLNAQLDAKIRAEAEELAKMRKVVYPKSVVTYPTEP